MSDYEPSMGRYATNPPPAKDKPVKGTVLAQGADSALIRTDEGETILTDKNGHRRP